MTREMMERVVETTGSSPTHSVTQEAARNNPQRPRKMKDRISLQRVRVFSVNVSVTA